MSNLNNIDELSKLNDEERKVALEILQQFSISGQSDLFNELKYADYKEIPVDIETFLSDDNYLGKA